VSAASSRFTGGEAIVSVASAPSYWIVIGSAVVSVIVVPR